MVNNSLNKLVTEILNKRISVTNIYRRTNSIEIECKNPISYISIIYKNNEYRDLDYTELDNKIYHLIKL